MMEYSLGKSSPTFFLSRSSLFHCPRRRVFPASTFPFMENFFSVSKVSFFFSRVFLPLGTTSRDPLGPPIRFLSDLNAPIGIFPLSRFRRSTIVYFGDPWFFYDFLRDPSLLASIFFFRLPTLAFHSFLSSSALFEPPPSGPFFFLYERPHRPAMDFFPCIGDNCRFPQQFLSPLKPFRCTLRLLLLNALFFLIFFFAIRFLVTFFSPEVFFVSFPVSSDPRGAF